MIKDSVTVDEVIGLLNSMLQVDQAATRRLIESRVVCNPALANHPTIQVSGRMRVGQYMVGPLGLMNGMFGTDERGYGAIAAVYSVVCSNDVEHGVGKGETINDECKTCGEGLMLGDLDCFQRSHSPKSEKTDEG